MTVCTYHLLTQQIPHTMFIGKQLNNVKHLGNFWLIQLPST